MGNSHSTSTSRTGANNSERAVNQDSHSNVQTSNDSARPSVKLADGEKTSNPVQRRRSILKLPYPKKKSRNTAGIDEAGSSNAPVTSSPSRRGWERFRSLKPRRVSSITASSSILPDLDRSLPSSSSSESATATGSKGKDKEQETQSSNVKVEEDRRVSAQADVPLGGHESIGEGRPEAMSDTLIQELRNLQSEEDRSDHESRIWDRPPTPIPTPEDPRDASRAELSEAIGSWLGGRSQTQSQTQRSSMLSGSRTPQSSTLAESHPPVSSPRSSSRSQSLPNIPRVHPDISNRPALSPERGPRPLPPTGTGAIVVVQGVVHTTDTPLRSIDPARHSRPTPRPTPSTPFLRTSRNASNSSSYSRSSTPQPSSRSRLSNLTEPFRNRSRPSTSGSLRSTTNPSEHQSQLFGHMGEPESDGSVSLMGRSDTGTSSTSLTEPSSSVAAVVSTEDRSSSETLSPADGASNERRFHGPGDHATFAGRDQSNNDSDNTSEEESDSELSASSIEVLGTLLSVATAATAASLVSGTTEPLFSSGLAARANALADTTDGPPSEPPLNADRDNADPRNTRIRNAWDSLRDRLRGRRRRTDSIRDSVETGELQLLRQMAQALNLELDGPGDRQESTPSPREGGEGRPMENLNPTQNSSRVPPPPPDSGFDRFLYNLQEDLRTALVEDYAARRARARTQQSRGGNTSEGQPIEPPAFDGPPVAGPSGASEPALPSTSEEGPSLSKLPKSAAVDGLAVNSAPSEVTAGSSTTAVPEPDSPIADYPATPRTAHLDMPPLPAAVDQTPNDSNRPQAQGITGQPGAGINWWRLYRFPPMAMTSTNPDGQNATNGNGNADTSASQSTVDSSPPFASPPFASTSTSPVSPLQDGPTSFPARTSPAAATLGSPTTQHVVPVIVVGLQSVPSRRPRNAEREQGETVRLPTAPQQPESVSEMGPFSPEPSDIPVRDRAWPLRAASRAFNRHGDNTTPPTPPAEVEPPSTERGTNTGGRTYLIFVIGGYYPPNHSLVTGADDMNSFEALWELAELIGQVKPPVATKEDIEKAGLPVFKASELAEYESSGKIAANTIENCLICLEPYEPDEDLRLLSCRHAFHQQCVDKWLEQGRNNCPVCRSLGATPNSSGPTESSSSTDA